MNVTEQVIWRQHNNKVILILNVPMDNFKCGIHLQCL